jgi:hypothetical protein
MLEAQLTRLRRRIASEVVRAVNDKIIEITSVYRSDLSELRAEIARLEREGAPYASYMIERSPDETRVTRRRDPEPELAPLVPERSSTNDIYCGLSGWWLITDSDVKKIDFNS